MPRGDRTGPMGMGPMTGRAAGYCAGFSMPGYANPAFGRGFGTGFGRGWRHWYHATGLVGWMRFGGYAAPYGYPAQYQNPDPEMAKQALQNQAEYFENELADIRRRLEEIDKETGKEKV